jgi:hypothetical protein
MSWQVYYVGGRRFSFVERGELKVVLVAPSGLLLEFINQKPERRHASFNKSVQSVGCC